MNIISNQSLLEYNTFGIQVNARFFVEVNSITEIRELLSDKKNQALNKLVLGGGSNLLFTKNFDGIAIKNNLKGFSLVKEDEAYYYIKAQAGENWHQFVLYCVANNYSGIENLSLIPGNVGASPMQNIGAYGVEVKDVFESLEAIEISTGLSRVFNNSECNFGYRESVFKNKEKDKYIITSVTYRLAKKPKFNTSYGAIEQELEQMKVNELSIKAISDAVINIRKSKLPDPSLIGNAGSFFKNPVVDLETFNEIKANFPDIVSYKNSTTEYKLAAGWLIEKAGWKGKTFTNYGVHKNQALVLVNYGGASGKAIYNLSEEIIDSIKVAFGVKLEREVNIL